MFVIEEKRLMILESVLSSDMKKIEQYKDFLKVCKPQDMRDRYSADITYWTNHALNMAQLLYRKDNLRNYKKLHHCLRYFGVVDC